MRIVPELENNQPALGEKLGINLGVRLGVNEARVFDAIIKNQFITIVEIAQNLNISTTAVENNIAKLKEKSLIHRAGSDKSGHWEVLRNPIKFVQ
ncbi:MAG: winged helix-turn-helix transcriptional regulator [Candidatus Omnitrophica bacterium]|nr:winged helix-turn-helix transcriptional regulator [Candidatus Omnitrophota bacterium]